MGDPNNTIEALGTTADIVESLAVEGPAGVTELANRLDIPKSTVFVHLNTLHNEELLINEHGRYRISYRFVEIGQRLLMSNTLYEHAHNEVRGLANETGLLVNLMVEEDGYGIYLCSISGSESINLQAVPGDRAPLHATGLGQAILAHLPKERVDEIIEQRGLEERTSNTITDRETLFEELEKVRERGVAVDDEENLKGVKCLSVPITDQSTVLGALSVSGPVAQIDRRYSELKDAVVETANVIELNVVYQ
ncbi:IclR family transcriptional regulator [Natrialbaceae archaeon A-CW3]